MSDMNLIMKRIMTNLEEKVKDKETLEIVKTEMFNLYNAFADEVIELNAVMNNRVLELAQAQKETNEKMDKMAKSLKKIENDIYLDEDEDDGEYTMEVICPYCNKEISLDIDEIADKDEISCPECKNTIELDWGNECNCDDCGDDCDCCGEDCHKDEDDNL